MHRIHWLKSFRKGCRSDLAKFAWVVEYEKLSTFMPCSFASTSPRFLDTLFSTSGKRGLPLISAGVKGSPAAPAVTGDAGPGHRFKPLAVEVDRELARAVGRGEVVVLGKLDRGIAVRGVHTRDTRRAAPFDRVGADVPLGVAPDRGVDVEVAGVLGAAARCDVVVLDVERDAAVVVPAASHAPAVAEVLDVAKHR